MNSKLRKLLIQGFRRRHKEVMRACIVTFLSVFFICGILLFQENMYQWQMAENRKQFGDWFAMESYAQTKGLIGNEYLTDALTAKTYVNIYDNEWMKIGVNAGTMSQDFIKNGNIRIVDGHMPETETEIVCDYNTLSKLGYDAVIEQEITFHYYYNDKISSSIDPKRTATYTLCGVVENFTDSWSVERFAPGALLTEAGAELLETEPFDVYMYQLRPGNRTDDYTSIYESLSKYNSKKIYYNHDVYDFKPWGPESIYNYIYILVMVIGITSLTYQMISYQHSRTTHYRKLYRLGVEKKTVWHSRSMENVLIMVPSGILGLLMAYLTGRVIGWRLESIKGVAFFHITLEVVLKSLVSLILALAVAEVVNIFMTFIVRQDAVGDRVHKNGKNVQKENHTIEESTNINQTDTNSNRHGDEEAQVSEAEAQNGFYMSDIRAHKHRGRLTRRNATWQLHVRLARSNGIAMRLGTRIFALGITAVIIFCSMNIYSAVKEYQANAYKSDITGFQTQEGNTPTRISYTYDTTTSGAESYKRGTEEYYIGHMVPMLGRDEYISWKKYMREYRISKGHYVSEEYIYRYSDVNVAVREYDLREVYCKYGNTTVFQGISENMQSKMEQTPGIASLFYSSYDTSRVWDWETMDYETMGIAKVVQANESHPVAGYNTTYYFATEYVDPTKQLYERLSKYIDPSRVDYDAFAKGEQILVFVDKNPSLDYDRTLKAGTKINFHYYQLPLTIRLAELSSSNSVQSSSNEEKKEPLFSYWNNFITKCTGKYYELKEVKDPYFNEGYTYYDITEASETEELDGLYYDMMYGSCVSSEAAAVIRVTEEVKEEFRDLIPEYAYYTALASSELGKQACEKQNELMKRSLGEDYTEDMECTFAYNQVSARYDLSASFSATDNVLSAYFRANNVSFKSSAAEKEVYRTAALNAILQYGITMIAAIVINILVYSILNRNRLELRRRKMQLLAQLGTTKSRIRRICMLEVLRESLWCIFTAPLQLLVQYVICRRNIRKL